MPSVLDEVTVPPQSRKASFRTAAGHKALQKAFRAPIEPTEHANDVHLKLVSLKMEVANVILRPTDVVDVDIRQRVRWNSKDLAWDNPLSVRVELEKILSYHLASWLHKPSRNSIQHGGWISDLLFRKMPKVDGIWQILHLVVVSDMKIFEEASYRQRHCVRSFRAKSIVLNAVARYTNGAHAGISCRSDAASTILKREAEEGTTLCWAIDVPFVDADGVRLYRFRVIIFSDVQERNNNPIFGQSVYDLGILIVKWGTKENAHFSQGCSRIQLILWEPKANPGNPNPRLASQFVVGTSLGESCTFRVFMMLGL